jgi:hypothetical protein
MLLGLVMMMFDNGRRFQLLIGKAGMSEAVAEEADSHTR